MPCSAHWITKHNEFVALLVAQQNKLSTGDYGVRTSRGWLREEDRSKITKASPSPIDKRETRKPITIQGPIKTGQPKPLDNEIDE